MKANKLVQDSQNSTARATREINTEDTTNARCHEPIRGNDVRDKDKEIEVSSSYCVICNKEVSNLKGHCEKHCVKDCCITSLIYCKEDCNQECCEKSENASKYKNMCSQNCGKDCCVISTNSCKKCVCIDCCEDSAKGCNYCNCNESCVEKDEVSHFQKDAVSGENDRILSGSSEEDLKKVNENKSKSKTESASEDARKVYKSVLEEMRGKVEEINTRKNQAIANNDENLSKKEGNTAVFLDAESEDTTAQKDDQKSPGSEENNQELTYNWWYQKTPKPNNSRNNEVPSQQGKKHNVSWWDSKRSQSDEKENSEKKPENTSNKEVPDNTDNLPETQTITRHEESCLMRILNMIFSIFFGNEENQEESYCRRIINFFYGLFQQAIGDVPPEPSIEHFPNPEVTALIPSALRRRNVPDAKKDEGSSATSWMSRAFSRKSNKDN